MGDGDREKLLAMLYADLRGFLAGGVGDLWSWVTSRSRRVSARKLSSLTELLQALSAGEIPPDSVVTFPARPVAFGPYNRTPYLTPIIGTRTSQRLGPPIVSTNPALAILGQISCHWMPVGLYPAPAEGLFQGSLFEPDARACGVLSLTPFGPKIQSLPFVADNRHRHRVDHPSTLVGTVRLLTEADLAGLQIKASDYEALRKAGALWMFDMTGDESNATPFDCDREDHQLWGALYACGHFEFEKAPDRAKVIEALAAAFERRGLPTSQLHDQVRGDTLLAARGVRLTLGGRGTGAIFSLHQDVELLNGYGAAHKQFQILLRECLTAANYAFILSGTELLNPGDVDFSYVNATDAYTVLRSAAANGIGEPVALAVRNWHRRRSELAGPPPMPALTAGGPTHEGLS